MVDNRLPRVFAVVPVFNRVEKTLRFLESIEKSAYKNVRVIIVDDGSTDGVEVAVRQNFPDVVIIKSAGNLWWSGSTNLGVRYALANGSEGDYVYTINNDVELDPYVLVNLMETAQKHKNALVGNIIYDDIDKDNAWYYGAVFNRQLGIIEHKHGKLPKGPRVRPSEWLTGMGVLIPLSAYKDIGLYDERNFPQHIGDADLSIRAAKSDYKLLVDTKAKIYTDTKSAWMSGDLAKKPWSFTWELFFSKASAYRLKPRFIFYSRHWGEGWPKAYIKANMVVIRGIFLPFIKAKIRASL